MGLWLAVPSDSVFYCLTNNHNRTEILCSSSLLTLVLFLIPSRDSLTTFYLSSETFDFLILHVLSFS